MDMFSAIFRVLLGFKTHKLFLSCQQSYRHTATSFFLNIMNIMLKVMCNILDNQSRQAMKITYFLKAKNKSYNMKKVNENSVYF